MIGIFRNVDFEAQTRLIRSCLIHMDHYARKCHCLQSREPMLMLHQRLSSKNHTKPKRAIFNFNTCSYLQGWQASMAEHDEVTATLQHYSTRFPEFSLKETSVRRLKNEYRVNLKNPSSNIPTPFCVHMHGKYRLLIQPQVRTYTPFPLFKCSLTSGCIKYNLQLK